MNSLPISRRQIEEWLIAYLANRLGLQKQEINVGQPFVEFGLASIEGITLVRELETWLNMSLSPTLAWSYPSIELLTTHLAHNLALREPNGNEMSSAAPTTEPIAIVGIACRFPGAENLDAFWDLLRHGVDAITDIPSDRWNSSHFYNPDPGAPGKMVSRRGGFLKDLDKFDAAFFAISPREAPHIDPRQRLILELVWEALEDAHIPPHSLAKSQTGVFIATLSADYGDTLFNEYFNLVDAYSGPGNAHSVIANRVSYFLDLYGPSISVDTACSGALVALHLACQSLQSGESSLALVGGVNVILRPDGHVFFSKAGALSPDGRCKTFDSKANGIARSEGAGILVLKPFSKAIAAGNPIWAVINGSAVNQDGYSNGLMAPNSQAQEAVLRQAYERANISPAQVQYIEAHGTGTALGDPIEVDALAKVLNTNRADGRICAIGSVKTNIGHTESAAGIAGLIKVLLALKHKRIPPNLHFRDPNPLINFQEIPLRVQQALGPWPQPDEPLIAGVSSFGIGGSNAHVILSEPPAAPMQTPEDQPLAELEPSPYLLPLSARKPAALQQLAAMYKDQVTQQAGLSLADLCYSAGRGRSHLEHRLACIFETHEELIGQLNAFAQSEPHPGLVKGSKPLERQPKLAFVFSGQGAHWMGMGRELLQQEPLFRATLEQCDELLGQYVEWSLLEILQMEAVEARFGGTDVVQPAVFSIQVALAALWRAMGIVPEVIVGQSLGEVAAAHVAGALSLEDAVRVVFYRSHLMKRTAGQGKTAVVGLPPEQAELILTGFEEELSVAGSNGPETSLLSGEPVALQRVLKSLEKKNIFCRLLPDIDIAFHSPQMDGIRDELVTALAPIKPRPTVVPLYSTVLGDLISGPQLDAEYWGRNLREPFLFGKVVEQLIEAEFYTFLEVSPHPVLAAPILENLARAGQEGIVVPSLRRQEPEHKTLLASLGRLYTLGHEVDWSHVFPGKGRYMPLPSYPWQKVHYWYDDLVTQKAILPEHKLAPKRKAGAHPLLGEHIHLSFAAGQHVWQNEVNVHTVYYLPEHRVQGAVILPGASYLEMIFAAARQVLAHESWVLQDVSFKQALFLPETDFRQIQLAFVAQGPDLTAVQVASHLERDPSAWTIHMTGQIKNETAVTITADTAVLPIQKHQANLPHRLAGQEHYALMRSRGLDYGPSFQIIQEVWRREGEALGRLQLPDAAIRETTAYQIHPTLLDAAFQIVATTFIEGENADKMFLPVGLKQIRLHKLPQDATFWCRAQLRPDTAAAADQLEADIVLTDEAGEKIMTVSGLRLQNLEGARPTEPQNPAGWLYEVAWHTSQRPSLPMPVSVPAFLPDLKQLGIEIEPLALELNQKYDLSHYATQWEHFDALALAYIVQTFRDLGLEFAVGHRFSAATLMAEAAIAPQHEQVCHRYLAILQEENIIKPAGEQWEICQTPPSPEIQPLVTSLLTRYPDSRPEIQLLAHCGPRIGEVLRGRLDTVALLFPEGSLHMVEAMYQDSCFTRVYNQLLAAAVKKAVSQLPADRPLRILEIGAGTGGTTTHVVPHLPAHQTEYTFTDVGQLFLNKAKQKFAHYSFIQYRLLDIETDAEAQGFMKAHYDLILGANVLHATHDLKQNLAHIRRLLAPGGMMLLLEGPGPQRWMDVTFGLTEGWWRFSDVEIRPSYPLLAEDAWQHLLQQAGFVETVSVTEPSERTPQFVLLAKSPVSQTSLADASPQLAHDEGPGSWLIFADQTGTGQTLATLLQARGERPVLVSAADSFAELAPDHYQLNPTCPDDFTRLLVESLPPDQPACRHIIHMWALNSPALTDITKAEHLEWAQALICDTSLHIIQAAAQFAWHKFPRVWFVTRGSQFVTSAADVSATQAALWGIGRVVANEHAEIWGGLIDLDPQPAISEAASLLAECWAPDGENQIAIRQGQRYVARLLHTTLTQAATRPLSLRSDGSYLITGGTNGIGLAIAERLVAKGARRLILAGRSKFPPRSTWRELADDHPLRHRIAAIQALEAKGAAVHLTAVDVSDQKQMEAFISQYKAESWPPIRGVIHSAGLIQDQLLVRMDKETFNAPLRPKMYGAWLLHQLFKDDPLDFFVLYSSATSIFGMFGQANYAAGNAFMDALAHHRHSQGLPALSINWGSWAQIGIVARMGNNAKTSQLSQLGIKDIQPEQGLRLAEGLLNPQATHTAQLAIVPIDWSAWRDFSHPIFSQLQAEQKKPSQAEIVLPEESTIIGELLLLETHEERKTFLQSQIQEVLAQVMRLEASQLAPGQSLNSLGIDSIMAVELKTYIEDNIGVTLSIVDFLQGATLSDLAEKLLAGLELENESRLDDLLGEIESLSEEEVEALLARGI